MDIALVGIRGQPTTHTFIVPNLGLIGDWISYSIKFNWKLLKFSILSLNFRCKAKARSGNGPGAFKKVKLMNNEHNHELWIKKKSWNFPFDNMKIATKQTNLVFYFIHCVLRGPNGIAIIVNVK